MKAVVQMIVKSDIDMLYAVTWAVVVIQRYSRIHDESQ